ncbi:hypothetical protein PFLuk1_01234 [Pseudomonas fluorescens]|nr:hypothetical protein PFLuk1_01234 [Pseudomonas fluorescens]
MRSQRSDRIAICNMLRDPLLNTQCCFGGNPWQVRPRSSAIANIDDDFCDLTFLRMPQTFVPYDQQPIMPLQAITDCIENNNQTTSTRYGFLEAWPPHTDTIDLPENMLGDMVCALSRRLDQQPTLT